LRSDVNLVSFAKGNIVLRLSERVPSDIPLRLRKLLQEWTGQDWVVEASQDEGMPTLLNQEKSAYDELIERAKTAPLVAKTLESFPGAEIVAIA
jgi:DNA polymerase-3 subunit gamma/tau